MNKTNAVSIGIGKAAGMAALLAGLVMCWLMLTPPAHAEEEDPFTGTPVLIQHPAAPYPSKVPLAVHSGCPTHITCWNILWGGYSYWVLEYGDNHFRIVIAAYDDQGELIAYKDYPGYRYVEHVELDEENEKLLFTTRHKEYSKPLEIPWSDLESLTGVQILLSDAVVKGGQPVVLKAKVKGLSPSVTGQVVFRRSTQYGINGPILHDMPLDLDENGEAVLTVSLPPGKHTVVAEYRRVPDEAESYSREYTLLVEGEPGEGPYVEYRSPEDVPIAAPPDTTLRTVFAGPLNRYVPMVKWGDFEYWFYEPLDDELWYGQIIVAAFDRDGIMKGFSDRGTYVLTTTNTIYDVSVDMANSRVVVHGQQWNSDNVHIPFADLIALRQMLISSSTSLTVSADTILEKRTVTLAAEVQSSEGVVPAGKVKFFSGNVELGAADLQDGAATLSVSDLPVGTHQIIARYLGDNLHENSDSPPVQLVVEERTLAGVPQVIYIPKANAPDLKSEGLYLNCLYQPEGDSVVHCPVMQWGGYDFWLYYDNQRARMFWAAIDGAGQPVGYRDAGRYLDLEDMTLDAASQKVTVTGKIAGQPWQVAFDWGDLADVVYSVRVTLTLNEDSPLKHEGDTVTLTARATGPAGPFTGKMILLEGDIPREEKSVTADGTAEFEIYLGMSGKYPRRVIYMGDSQYLDGDSHYVTVTAQYPEEYWFFKDFVPIVVYKLPKDRPAQSPDGDVSLRCFDSPAGFDGYCPVLLYKDFAYWVFAPGNDYAMLVVAYNEKGKIMGSKRYDGARYVYDAVVDYGGTIELRGQSDNTNIMTWHDLEEMITGTVTELSVSHTLAIEGTPVTLSAAVAGYRSGLTGTVIFMAGASVLGTVPLIDGKAELTVTGFAIGKHQLKAVYSGDGIHDPSESDPVELTVKPDAPPEAEIVTLSSSNPAAGWAKAGDTVTLEFTASDAVQNVAITIAGHWVTAEQTDEEGYAWRASHMLDAADPEGAIAFTLDFESLFGTAAEQVTSTTDGSKVIYDKSPPTLTLLGNPVVHHEVLAPYEDAGAVASDNYADDATITGWIMVSSNVDVTKPGTYTIAYNVQDQAGNAATEITRTVHVADTTPPVIVLLGDSTVTLQAGQAYVEAGYEAGDNYDGDLTGAVIITGKVDTSRPGTYTLTYSVSDSSGNQAHKVRTIHVLPAGGGSGPGDGGGDDRDGGSGPGDGGDDRDGGSGGDAVSDPSAPEPAGQRVDVYINGKPESAGVVTISDVNGRKTAVITLDESLLEQRMNDEGEHAVIAIYAPVESEAVIGELTGRIIKQMEVLQAVVELQTDKASYKIPAPLFNIDEIANRFGTDVSLQDIKVQIEILTPSEEEIRFAEDAAGAQGIAIVVPPVGFSIRAVHDGQTVDISNFRAFVERLVAIPDDLDPDRLTTGVCIGPDGGIHHVPTRIVTIDGQIYAQINSPTNSLYAVIRHQAAFPDIGGHWAEDIIANLGSRLVLSGYEDGTFRPDQPITRAEFAAYMVRGLGLRGQQSALSFTDMSENDGYHDAAGTAVAYGLIRGYADGRFAGSEWITREQAMVIIARAMALTDLQGIAGDATEREILLRFTDAAQVSDWARRDVASSVRAGIVTGRDHGTLAPRDALTRAEAAVLIHRLLVQSGLIDE